MSRFTRRKFLIFPGFLLSLIMSLAAGEALADKQNNPATNAVQSLSSDKGAAQDNHGILRCSAWCFGVMMLKHNLGISRSNESPDHQFG